MNQIVKMYANIYSIYRIIIYLLEYFLIIKIVLGSILKNNNKKKIHHDDGEASETLYGE